jgi:hypothetical protein
VVTRHHLLPVVEAKMAAPVHEIDAGSETASSVAQVCSVDVLK